MRGGSTRMTIGGNPSGGDVAAQVGGVKVGEKEGNFLWKVTSVEVT